MKKMLLTLLVCLISALASGSDGTGVLGERVCKDVKPFSALSITKDCNVVYEQGDEYNSILSMLDSSDILLLFEHENSDSRRVYKRTNRFI